VPFRDRGQEVLRLLCRQSLRNAGPVILHDHAPPGCWIRAQQAVLVSSGQEHSKRCIGSPDGTRGQTFLRKVSEEFPQQGRIDPVRPHRAEERNGLALDGVGKGVSQDLQVGGDG
jgi:hypothetical protein